MVLDLGLAIPLSHHAPRARQHLQASVQRTLAGQRGRRLGNRRLHRLRLRFLRRGRRRSPVHRPLQNLTLGRPACVGLAQMRAQTGGGAFVLGQQFRQREAQPFGDVLRRAQHIVKRLDHRHEGFDLGAFGKADGGEQTLQRVLVGFEHARA